MKHLKCPSITTIVVILAIVMMATLLVGCRSGSPRIVIYQDKIETAIVTAGKPFYVGVGNDRDRINVSDLINIQFSKGGLVVDVQRLLSSEPLCSIEKPGTYNVTGIYRGSAHVDGSFAVQYVQ